MVIVGYGDYKNYRIDQVPDRFLSELASRYKLCHEALRGADYHDLQITIAVHEELRRREGGGQIAPREPTAAEIAVKLVSKGYQAMSRDHHPDRKGGSENTQKRLNQVREELLKTCNDMADEPPDGALIIQSPAREISDEDILF